jgi:hypothetical protein
MSHDRGSSEGAPPALGRAPRAKGLEAPRSAQDLVDELVGMYREQMKRALSVDLDDSDTTLAFVDHHLSTASDEDRIPILFLLASSAGAFYGELVRRHIGGTWIGDGKDPRRLRMLMKHQFIYFSPVDQALEAIAGKSLEPSDPRLDGAERFDPAFRLRPILDPETVDDDHDAVWLSARLTELPDVPESQFVSLTCRFETLKLMHELLATKHASEGKQPVELGMEDYLEALAADARANAEN